MNKTDIPGVLASVAASYARRELDRSVYDRVMSTDLGVSLSNLSDGQKYALEFVAYAVSAIGMRHTGDASAVKTFIREVASDVPSEIAKRMINGSAGFSAANLHEVIDMIPESRMIELAGDVENATAAAQAPIDNAGISDTKPSSHLSDLATKINASWEKIRERRKKRLR